MDTERLPSDDRQLMTKLLEMYDHLQRTVIAHMQDEGETVREIKDGLARVEAKVEEIMTAFPEGGAKHRLDHEVFSMQKQKTEHFWEKMKIVIATFVVGGVGAWMAVVLWRAFLLGPK